MNRCFSFLPGIGPKTLTVLEDEMVHDWDDFLKRGSIKGIGPGRKKFYDREIIRARRMLCEDSGYFCDKLPSSETWRLYRYYRDETAFLDIEASEVSDRGRVTVIGLFDGYDTKIMIRDYNLDLRALADELKRYSLIVTYNGGSFDIPYLRKRYHWLLPDVPHIDLRPLCQRMGLAGGLKEIERNMGIKRGEIVDRMHGGDPFLLYRMWKGSGDEHYLKLLVEYNEEDCMSLRKIADQVCLK